MRELLEVLSLKHNYKILNHECYKSFLETKLNEKRVAIRFNKLRKIRNSINYFGKQYPLKQAKIILEEIDELRKEIIKIIKKKLESRKEL